MRAVTISRCVVLVLSVLMSLARADSMEVRVIYRCQANGVVTFADKPCDAAAVPYETDDSRVSHYAPSDPPADRAAESTLKDGPKRQKAPAVADPGKKAVTCEHVNSALRTIARKMRSGYGVREGEQLRDRKSQLEEKRRQLRCR